MILEYSEICMKLHMSYSFTFGHFHIYKYIYNPLFLLFYCFILLYLH